MSLFHVNDCLQNRQSVKQRLIFAASELFSTGMKEVINKRCQYTFFWLEFYWGSDFYENYVERTKRLIPFIFFFV